jgi:uncharacterized membrane protein YhhN
VRPLFAIAFVASAAAFFAAAPLGFSSARLFWKPLPVLVLATALASRNSSSLLARAVIGGLIVSSVGDVLLERGLFIPGLLAFLVAHLAYVAGFWSDSRRPAWLRALPFALWGVTFFEFLAPGLGPVTVPVGIYVAAIVAMMWRAAARVENTHGRAVAGLLGAIAFGLSDTLVAWGRFREALPWAAVPIMLLYWAGQAGIAHSVPDKETP